MDIINAPYSDYEYEFTVVKPLDGDTYEFIGYYTNGFKAEEKALEVGGVILHNVRITGKVAK